MMHEHMIETHRGKPDATTEDRLNALAGDGWRVVAAYATPGGSGTIWDHHYVLTRSLDDAGEPKRADITVTIEPGADLIKVVDEAKSAIAKGKSKGR